MQSSLSSNQEILAVASDVSSPAILLERGMRCIQQGLIHTTSEWRASCSPTENEAIGTMHIETHPSRCCHIASALQCWSNQHRTTVALINKFQNGAQVKASSRNPRTDLGKLTLNCFSLSLLQRLVQSLEKLGYHVELQKLLKLPEYFLQTHFSEK